MIFRFFLEARSISRLSLLGRAGKWLLNEYMLAVFERRFCQLIMRPHRSYDGNGVDFRWTKSPLPHPQSRECRDKLFVLAVAPSHLVLQWKRPGNRPDWPGSAPHSGPNIRNQLLRSSRRFTILPNDRTLRIGLENIPWKQVVVLKKSVPPYPDGKISISTLDHGGRSAHQNLEIEPQRPEICILQVQADHLIEANLAAPGHLPKPGNSRLHLQYPAPVPGLICSNLIRNRRPRSNQGHISPQHIEELR